MFNDMLIVTTAISSFNNAALFSPLFLVIGLLMLPLFVMVVVYGRDFVTKLGWNDKNIDNNVSFWTSSTVLLWLMLFGGNYAVIRDGISLLPLLLAVVLLLLMIIVSQKYTMLGYANKIRDKKTKLALFGLLLLMAGFSAIHNWYGILLQISAVVCGFIIGSRFKKNIALVPWNIIVFCAVLILVLMQPEYFRFGQLGNLTVVHLLSAVFVALCGVTALVTKYVHARSKVHQSAYVKLKWFFRILSLLALVLFISTESIPVFIGLMGAVALLEMLSVYHSKNLDSKLSKQAFSLFLIGFGIIIICPVISAIGITYAAMTATGIKARDFLSLL